MIGYCYNIKIAIDAHYILDWIFIEFDFKGSGEMAIIVRHNETRKVFALVGTGFGAYKATRPGVFGGNLFPNEEEGTIPVAAVSDERGSIQWLSTDELQVIEIDGVKIENVIDSYIK